jgi:alpha/beta superfamily hydrolase
MGNTIVSRVARALRDAGLATLRFNFRGVAGSEGEHDGSGGEEQDASAALDWLSGENPRLGLWAAGYSFGARVVCALALREERIRRAILVALSVRTFDCRGIAELRGPALLLFGSRDGFGTLSDLNESCPDLSSALELDEIDGADHAFRGRTPLVEERVRAYALRALEES